MKDLNIIEVLLISLRARKKAASGYAMNQDMGIEETLLHAQIKTLEDQLKTVKHDQKLFKQLLINFEETAIVHANSGGGHPSDAPLKKNDYYEAKKELIKYVTERLK